MRANNHSRALSGSDWPSISGLAVYGHGSNECTVRIYAEARNGWWIVERSGGSDGIERVCVKGVNLRRVAPQLF